MNRSRARVTSYSLGGLMVAALVLGGGTATSLPTDAVIQIATVVICGGILLTKRSRDIDWRLLLFPILVILVIGAQLVPLPSPLATRWWPAATREAWQAAGGGYFAFMTISIEGTMRSLAYFMSATLLLYTLASLSYEQRNDIMRILAFGVGFNMFVGLFQMAVSGFQPIHVSLPYPIRGGMFTNPNHFSTLMVMAIPPLILWFISGERLLSIVALLIALLLILGSQSAAGVLMALAITILSMIFIGGGFVTNRKVVLPAVIVIGGIFLFGAARQLAFENFSQGFNRLDMLKTSLSAIRENPIFGTGFGSFLHVYPIYERAEDVFSEYVNHAHNDYAELIMEGGLVAAGLIVLYFVLLVTRTLGQFKYPVARTAALSISVVLVHSTVDYPLRTLGIVYVFVFAHAVLFSRHHADETEEPIGQGEENTNTLVLSPGPRPPSLGTTRHSSQSIAEKPAGTSNF